MVVKEDSPQQTLAVTKNYPHKSDIESSFGSKADWPDHQPSYYLPPPPKTNSKNFVYILTIFVLITFILLTFSLVVIKIKNPRIHLDSVQITSLQYDASQPPYFYAAMSAQISIKNPNFGPLEISSIEINVVYDDCNTDSAVNFVGGGEARPSSAGEKNINKWRIGALKGEKGSGRRRVAVVVVSEKAEMLRSQEGDVKERDRLRSQLSYGVLELTLQIKVTGEVTLFKKIRGRAEGWAEFPVSIDLVSQRVNKLL